MNNVVELIKEELNNDDYEYDYFKEEVLDIINQENPDLEKAYNRISVEINCIEKKCNVFLNGNFKYDPDSAAGKEIAEMNRLKHIAEIMRKEK